MGEKLQYSSLIGLRVNYFPIYFRNTHLLDSQEGLLLSSPLLSAILYSVLAPILGAVQLSHSDCEYICPKHGYIFFLRLYTEM